MKPVGANTSGSADGSQDGRRRVDRETSWSTWGGTQPGRTPRATGATPAPPRRRRPCSRRPARGARCRASRAQVRSGRPLRRAAGQPGPESWCVAAAVAQPRSSAASDGRSFPYFYPTYSRTGRPRSRGASTFGTGSNSPFVEIAHLWVRDVAPPADAGVTRVAAGEGDAGTQQAQRSTPGPSSSGTAGGECPTNGVTRPSR